MDLPPNAFVGLIRSLHTNYIYMCYRQIDGENVHEWFSIDGKRLLVVTETFHPMEDRGINNTALLYYAWRATESFPVPDEDDFYRYGTMWSGTPAELCVSGILLKDRAESDLLFAEQPDPEAMKRAFEERQRDDYAGEGAIENLFFK